MKVILCACFVFKFEGFKLVACRLGLRVCACITLFDFPFSCVVNLGTCFDFDYLACLMFLIVGLELILGFRILGFRIFAVLSLVVFC